MRVDGQEIQLNGIALRTRYAIFKVYVAGLYLPQKTTSGQTAIDARGAKRMVAGHAARRVGAEQFIESFDVALRANNSEAQLAEVKAQKDDAVRQDPGDRRGEEGLDHRARLRAFQRHHPGDRRRAVKGKPMPGEAFYRAILRSWVGENPAQEDMKKALLGG